LGRDPRSKKEPAGCDWAGSRSEEPLRGTQRGHNIIDSRLHGLDCGDAVFLHPQWKRLKELGRSGEFQISFARERKPALVSVGVPPGGLVAFLASSAAKPEMEPAKAVPQVSEAKTESKFATTLGATVLLHSPS
jgi:hypothetical protein